MAVPNPEPAAPPALCAPCRGTGRIVSGLGGTPHSIACPWCDGTGVAIPGRNAQEHAGAGEPSASAPAA